MVMVLRASRNIIQGDACTNLEGERGLYKQTTIKTRADDP